MCSDARKIKIIIIIPLCSLKSCRRSGESRTLSLSSQTTTSLLIWKLFSISKTLTWVSRLEYGMEVMEIVQATSRSSPKKETLLCLTPPRESQRMKRESECALDQNFIIGLLRLQQKRKGEGGASPNPGNASPRFHSQEEKGPSSVQKLVSRTHSKTFSPPTNNIFITFDLQMALSPPPSWPGRRSPPTPRYFHYYRVKRS